MRKSPQRTTMAVLRITLGFRLEEFASLLGCKRSALQDIELCRRTLDEKIAVQASFKTGVSLRWLLNNDPSKPIVDECGKPYTRETFQLSEEFSNEPIKTRDDDEIGVDGIFLGMSLLRVLKMAGRRSRQTYAVTLWKLESVLKELAADESSKLDEPFTFIEAAQFTDAAGDAFRGMAQDAALVAAGVEDIDDCPDPWPPELALWRDVGRLLKFIGTPAFKYNRESSRYPAEDLSQNRISVDDMHKAVMAAGRVLFEYKKAFESQPSVRAALDWFPEGYFSEPKSLPPSKPRSKAQKGKSKRKPSRDQE